MDGLKISLSIPVSHDKQFSISMEPAICSNCKGHPVMKATAVATQEFPCLGHTHIFVQTVVTENYPLGGPQFILDETATQDGETISVDLAKQAMQLDLAQMLGAMPNIRPTRTSSSSEGLLRVLLLSSLLRDHDGDTSPDVGFGGLGLDLDDEGDLDPLSNLDIDSMFRPRPAYAGSGSLSDLLAGVEQARTSPYQTGEGRSPLERFRAYASSLGFRR